MNDVKLQTLKKSAIASGDQADTVRALRTAVVHGIPVIDAMEDFGFYNMSMDDLVKLVVASMKVVVKRCGTEVVDDIYIRQDPTERKTVYTSLHNVRKLSVDVSDWEDGYIYEISLWGRPEYIRKTLSSLKTAHPELDFVLYLSGGDDVQIFVREIESDVNYKKRQKSLIKRRETAAKKKVEREKKKETKERAQLKKLKEKYGA